MVDDTIECPTCGAEIEEDLSECPLCGEMFDEDTNEILQELEKIEGMTEEDTIECPLCSSEIEKDAEECPICGEPIEETEECPVCRATVVEGTTECPECGERLEMEEEEEGWTEEETIEEEIKGEETEEETIEEEEKEKGKIKEDIEEKVEGERKEEIEREGWSGVEEERTEVMVEPETVGEDEEQDMKDMEMTRSELIAPLFSFIMPLFFMAYVSLEFFTVLLTYPLAYPSEVLLYLTPLPFFESSAIPPMTISFIVVTALFLLTLRGYDFGDGPEEGFKLDRKMVLLASIFSIIMAVSLGIYLYYVPLTLDKLLTYILFFLILFTAATQIDLVRNHKRFIRELEGEEEKETREMSEERAAGYRELEVNKDVEEKAEKEKEEIPKKEVSKGEETKVIPETDVSEEEVSEEKDMIRCPNCGIMNDRDSAYCVNCEQDLSGGTRVWEEEEIIEDEEEEGEKKAKEEELEEKEVCSVCGAELTPDTESCPECGEPLIEVEKEIEDIYSDLEGVIEEKEESAVAEEIEREEETEGLIEQLMEIEGIGEKTAQRIVRSGYDTVESISGAEIDELAEISNMNKDKAEEIEERFGKKEETMEEMKEKEPKECPLCAAEIPEGADSCPECGEPLNGADKEEDRLF